MKTIAIDLDTTLNNLDEAWLALYNKDYDDNLTVNDVVCWDWETFVKPECGKRIYNYLDTPHLFRDLVPKKDSQDVIKWLSKYYKLYIATAYRPLHCIDKANWIKKHYPDIDPKNIIFINDKGTLNVDYLIDDGCHNINAFNQTGLLFTAPYNLNYINNKPNREVFRVDNWSQIMVYFAKELIKDGEK